MEISQIPITYYQILITLFLSDAGKFAVAYKFAVFVVGFAFYQAGIGSIIFSGLQIGRNRHARHDHFRFEVLGYFEAIKSSGSCYY